MKNLQPEENQILRAKYGATRFRNMTEEQIDVFGDAMLLKISVITGWMLPTETLQNLLVDQFKKKMLESYAECNAEEVEYAFRNYGYQVKDWGKQMNLNLIDEVMRPYLQKRREQSFAEERVAELPASTTKPESLSDFAMLRWLAREIQFIKTGKPMEFVPQELYDYLDKRGAIKATNDEKYEYLRKAVVRFGGELAKEATNSKLALERYEHFKLMTEIGCLYGSEAERVKRLAKKLLFVDLALKRQP